MKKAAIAVAEHSLFAFSSFLVNIMAARWLTGEEHGSYALAYSLLLLIGAGHTAFFTEPLLIFGAGRYAPYFSHYLAVLLRGHWLGAAASSILLILFALWCRDHKLLAPVWLGLALATPFVFLLWLMRRACYARLNSRLSALGGGLYLMLIVAGMSLLKYFDTISVLSLLLLTGLASLLVGWWLSFHLRHESGATLASGVVWREVRSAHWNYGRWAIAANLLWWVPLHASLFILSTQGQLADSATMKAMINIILPVIQGNAVLGALMLPRLVSETHHPANLARILKRCLTFFCAAAVLYYLILGVAGAPLIHALYAGRYDSSVRLLWLIGLVPVLDGITVVFSGALRTLQRPHRIFWSYLSSAIVMLSVSAMGIQFGGLWGAAIAMVVSFFVASVMLAVPVYTHLRRTMPPTGQSSAPDHEPPLHRAVITE